MRALLLGYYGVRNLGDELMLHCLRYWLANQQVEITVLAEEAEEVRRTAGLPAVRNLPLLGQWGWRYVWLRGHGWNLLRELWRHDAIIAGGGDLIRDDRGWRSFTFSIEKFAFCILTRKPFYLVNVGIGEPATRCGRILMPWLLRRAAGIIVRDYRSLELCKRLGAGAVTRYAPDIVMHLPRFLPVPKPTKAADMYVAVCLRGRPNVYGRFDWNDVRTANFAAALDWLIAERGLRVVFLPFQTASGENDNSLHTAVRNRMQRADRAEIREWSGDLSEVASVLAGSRLVIAMRLHAAVVAAAFLRATVILPYDHKVAEFASQAAVGATLVAGDMDNALTIKAAFDAALTRAVSSRLSSEAAVWDSLTL